MKINNYNKTVIFLAGSAGSGKTYLINQLNLPFKVYGIDFILDKLIIANKMSLNMKTYDAGDRSMLASLMWDSKKHLDQQLEDAIIDGTSFILDGTGASSKKIINLNEKLKKSGYTTYMIFVVADLITCLDRNDRRLSENSKSINPFLLIKLWVDVMNNFDYYKVLFGAMNFYPVTNSNKNIQNKYSFDGMMKKYVDPYKINDSKKKSESKIKEKEKMLKDARFYLTKFPLFDNMVMTIDDVKYYFDKFK